MNDDEHDDLLASRGGRIDPLRFPDGPLDDDARIDLAIAESFPASDPPSWNGGRSRPWAPGSPAG